MNGNSGELHAVITGTTKGLGFCLCKQFLNRNYFVTGYARSPAPVEFLSFIQSGRYKHVVADLKSTENIGLVFAQVVQKNARVVIINAADYSVPEGNDEKSLAGQLSLNLVFPILLIQKILSAKLNPAPKVVFVSSIMAYIADSKTPAYGAAKSAVSHFMDGAQLNGETSVHFLNVIVGPMHENRTASVLRRLASTTYKKAARIIFNGISSGKKIIFVPGIWRYIIYVMRFTGKTFMSRMFNRLR